MSPCWLTLIQALQICPIRILIVRMEGVIVENDLQVAIHDELNDGPARN